MLKGLALTPPVIGRISIGKLVESGGKPLPQKDDEFTITSQIRTQNGWLPHPMDETLRKSAPGKLRTIPVRIVFNDPDLNLRANYSLFDRATGRPLCVGDGESCRRSCAAGMQSMTCPGPDSCELGQDRGCKPYGRLNVQIGEEDELGTFVFRTTGFNSIRTLAARLRYFSAASGGLLAGMPLELRLRGKSTAQSHGTPVFYVDLTLRSGVTLCDAIRAAKAAREERLSAGFDQEALDAAARAGLANGAFEESGEEGGSVVEEFFAEPNSGPSGYLAPEEARSLADKLRRKATAPVTGEEREAAETVS
jgi:hypothetical protein